MVSSVTPFPYEYECAPANSTQFRAICAIRMQRRLRSYVEVVGDGRGVRDDMQPCIVHFNQIISSPIYLRAFAYCTRERLLYTTAMLEEVMGIKVRGTKRGKAADTNSRLKSILVDVSDYTVWICVLRPLPSRFCVLIIILRKRKSCEFAFRLYL